MVAVPPQTTPSAKRGKSGATAASDEHDIAKYYAAGSGGASGRKASEDEDGIGHGHSYGSMTGYLQEDAAEGTPAPASGVGAVRSAATTGDDLDAYLQSEGMHSVQSDEGGSSDEVDITLEGGEGEVVPHWDTMHRDESPHSPAVTAAAAAAQEWRSPWSLSEAESAAVDAARSARYRVALKAVMKSAARRGEDLGSAIARKQKRKSARKKVEAPLFSR
jgi:hypothetical protein